MMVPTNGNGESFVRILRIDTIPPDRPILLNRQPTQAPFPVVEARNGGIFRECDRSRIVGPGRWVPSSTKFLVGIAPGKTPRTMNALVSARTSTTPKIHLFVTCLRLAWPRHARTKPNDLPFLNQVTFGLQLLRNRQQGAERHSENVSRICRAGLCNGFLPARLSSPVRSFGFVASRGYFSQDAA